MRFLVLTVLLLAPAAFASPRFEKIQRVIPFINNEVVEEPAAEEPATRAIASGSCGVNKFNSRSILDELLPQPYIVGGTEATPYFWPWQVSLQYGGSHTCGGTIYNNRYIITAAHCFTGMNTAGNWKVVAGEHDLTKTETSQKTYSVSSIIKHASYNLRTNVNDIALLKLSSAITFTDEIQPICLPAANAGDHSGKNATVTGWGATKEGGSAAPKLQQVVVPVITNTKCSQKYATETIGSGMLCAGYDAGGQDSCQGDSGGPLVLKSGNSWTLIGVVSWGYGCAQANYPGVYTRVTSYIDWITANAV